MEPALRNYETWPLLAKPKHNYTLWLRVAATKGSRMSDETINTATPSTGFKITHEVKFFAAVLVGLVPSPFLWKLVTVQDAANEITVRPPWFIGVVYVLLACYAAFEYVKHLRTEEPVIIPTIERYLILGIILLALAATHYCGAVVSVDQQKLVVFEPILALLGNTSHAFADLQQLELGQDKKGKDVLLVTRKGAAKSDSISCDAMLRQVLPKLSAAAKAKGVNVVGF